MFGTMDASGILREVHICTHRKWPRKTKKTEEKTREKARTADEALNAHLNWIVNSDLKNEERAKEFCFEWILNLQQQHPNLP